MILPLVGTVTTGALAGLGLGVALGGAGIAWLCTRRRDRRIGSPEDVAAAAEAALAGFTVAGAVVGADGQGALVVATDGRVAALKLQGRRIGVREIPWTRVRSGAEGIVAEVEGRFGPVMLAGVNVLDIRRLAPR
ncbi:MULTISPECIES: hypothetical protein [Sphingomonas]|jgi:hypothetical protein|uniref:Uncharacterized protein n=1 Tax=Sphingomonas parapaucimobilis NBRC 15100 TaxID=1219049 RepID=A0A0A1W4Q2_9SPHN|nr:MULTISPECIES: hypothetical protein [Sphingomonas]OMJ32601.1 hypothetical protein BSZ14_07805 [Sphingomonas sp. Sph1(2015)]GAM00405.1 hypothetical protein SP5_032_00270 [Sphingomonas parapaucimobilis NBRC 15100]